MSPVCCSKKFALVRTRVRFPLRLARTDRREPLCHFAEAPDLARIHFTVEPGAMTYPDSQRNVRPELSPCVVMDGLIERNDVVIGVTFFAWNDPIRDGLQCTPHFPAVLAPRQRMFHPLLMRTRQLERESDLGVFVLDRKSTRLNSSHGYISYAVFCLKKKTRLIIVTLCDFTMY